MRLPIGSRVRVVRPHRAAPYLISHVRGQPGDRAQVLRDTPCCDNAPECAGGHYYLQFLTGSHAGLSYWWHREELSLCCLKREVPYVASEGR